MEVNGTAYGSIPGTDDIKIQFSKHIVHAVEYWHKYPRVEVLLGLNGDENDLEVWAFDRTHGGGYWHCVSYSQRTINKLIVKREAKRLMKAA